MRASYVDCGMLSISSFYFKSGITDSLLDEIMWRLLGISDARNNINGCGDMAVRLFVTKRAKIEAC